MSDELMKCEECGEMFNPGNLDEVMKHCTNHKERPDVQYAGARKISPPTPEEMHRLDRDALKRAAMYAHRKAVRINCTHDMPENERYRMRALWGFIAETLNLEPDSLQEGKK